MVHERFVATDPFRHKLVSFQVMDGDKEAYLEEATKALRRQRKLIEDLEKERIGLQQSMKTSKSKRNSKRDSENAAKIGRLADEQARIRQRTLPTTGTSFGN